MDKKIRGQEGILRDCLLNPSPCHKAGWTPIMEILMILILRASSERMCRVGRTHPVPVRDVFHGSTAYSGCIAILHTAKKFSLFCLKLLSLQFKSVTFIMIIIAVKKSPSSLSSEHVSNCSLICSMIHSLFSLLYFVSFLIFLQIEQLWIFHSFLLGADQFPLSSHFSNHLLLKCSALKQTFTRAE